MAGYTIEDLLTNPDDAHYDVTDGVIRPIPFHTAHHQDTCGLLTDWFRRHVPSHLRAVHQVSVAFAVDSTREADVVVVRSEPRNDHAFPTTARGRARWSRSKRPTAGTPIA